MLLNRPKNIDVARLAAEEYINNNYIINGLLSFENVNGTCMVNCDSHVKVKNKDIEKLTDGFVWGKVRGIFDCGFCPNLKSLEGAPKEVDEDFYCYNCVNLTSLKGAPKEVGGTFSCVHCENLTSLKGAPKEVSGTFNCTCCKNLKSLEGAPEYVGEMFDCSYCKNLTSLKGVPKKVRRIDCDKRLKK